MLLAITVPAVHGCHNQTLWAMTQVLHVTAQLSPQVASAHLVPSALKVLLLLHLVQVTEFLTLKNRFSSFANILIED